MAGGAIKSELDHLRELAHLISEAGSTGNSAWINLTVAETKDARELIRRAAAAAEQTLECRHDVNAVEYERGGTQ